MPDPSRPTLVMVPIYELVNEATKRQFLPKLATGEWIGCFGMTEPNHGSDPGSMVTRARKVDGGYALTGSEMWITNSRWRMCWWSGPRTRWRNPRLRAGYGHAGFKRAGDPRQVWPAFVDHQ